MSTYVCPNCGFEAELFGHAGVRAEAGRLGLPFLGEMPLDLKIRLAGDGGVRAGGGAPDSPEAAGFRALARRLIGAGAA